ncbi:MAG TPA: ATP-binding protein [Candidatus Babeliales bacterium]|nr:ATP-binding protein [Candidatus Babeliales bacterium]
MKRDIAQHIKKDLEKKIVFISGPRQVGKTTLTKSLDLTYDYFNYDRAADRVALQDNSWDRNKELVIFDELHKMNQWKRWLKGIYDTEGVRPRILVTGSSKLETYRKVGDSLAGRYFQYRLYPFDLKEVHSHYSKEEAFKRLWECSGFPEPFIDGTEAFYHRWKRSHLDIILRQDLIDIQTIRDIQAIEALIELLKSNVGSTISYSNLARALEKDAKTIKRWLQLLENLYVVFKVTPYSKKISRSLLKEPKYYFYDSVQVSKDNGIKLENIVAAAILKELHRLEDVLGASTTKLHFLRTKDGKEIDFLVVINDKPYCLIEVKWSDDTPSKHFSYFENYFMKAKKIQLVKEIKRDKTYPNGLEIRNVVTWLSNIDFSDAVQYR